tara:strand:+ start:4377 stop:6206 length:1830 start_codon:yes stop_codon:yes gene_type:complete
MCGIVGYAGEQQASSLLMDSLKRLEYRGYDSAGIATFHEKNIVVWRASGKLVNLQNMINGEPIPGTVGIGHTRWATHGEPTEVNAHPHRSGHLVLVHNGIIENYVELKQNLVGDGYVFQSETDSEVVAHLIHRWMGRGYLFQEAVRLGLKDLMGSYAIVMLSEDAPGVLVAARAGCPLVVGLGDAEFFIASDIPAILHHTRKVIFLEDGEICTVENSQISITNLAGAICEKAPIHINWTPGMAEKAGYRHFMLKEIHEQPQAILHTIMGQYNPEYGEALLPDLGISTGVICNLERLWMVACGTSWHSALIGKYLIETVAKLPVHVELGSEFRHRNSLLTKGDVVIGVSQSGETADTLAGTRAAIVDGAHVIALCNSLGSTMTREANGVLYTHAGPEIGVASTKAFMGQVAAFYLLALFLGRTRGVLLPADGVRWCRNLVGIVPQIAHILANEQEIEAIAAKYYRHSNALYLGRGLNFPIALEGALKLKEISYIHAEGYAAGEMKHGPIALIDRQMPVVVLAPRDHLYDKMVSTVREVKARNGLVVAIVTEGDDIIGSLADDVYRIPDADPMFTPFLTVAPLQLLAYHIATLRGTDVDQPRNLAKSVTVE